MQIIIKATTLCNLACVYCSEGDREADTITDEVFYRLVDELPKLLEHIGDKEITFLWHGGEPLLLGIERLSRLMDYAKEQLSNYRVCFNMQSNGYLLDEKVIAMIKKYDLHMGISLDGYKDLHDASRRTKNNEPTFARIMENIKKLKAAGHNFGTLMVLNSAEEIDVNKLFAVIKEYGLLPKIHPVIPLGRAAGRKDSAEINRSYILLMEKLFEKAMADDAEIIIEPLDELLDAIIESNPVHECSYNGTCAKYMISLFPDGAVGYCGRRFNGENMLFGNIMDTGLVELYESVSAKLIRVRDKYLQENECKNCKYWMFCHGGCTFEAVEAFGDINHPYPGCEVRRGLVDYLKITGLKLLKERLIREKRHYRMRIKEKEKFLEGLQENERK